MTLVERGQLGGYCVHAVTVQRSACGRVRGRERRWSAFRGRAAWAGYLGDARPGQATRAQAVGGERGIRTPGTVSGSVVFKTTAIDHSAISPFFGSSGAPAPRLAHSITRPLRRPHHSPRVHRLDRRGPPPPPPLPPLCGRSAPPPIPPSLLSWVRGSA